MTLPLVNNQPAKFSFDNIAYWRSMPDINQPIQPFPCHRIPLIHPHDPDHFRSLLNPRWTPPLTIALSLLPQPLPWATRGAPLRLFYLATQFLHHPLESPQPLQQLRLSGTNLPPRFQTPRRPPWPGIMAFDVCLRAVRAAGAGLVAFDLALAAHVAGARIQAMWRRRRRPRQLRHGDGGLVLEDTGIGRGHKGRAARICAIGTRVRRVNLAVVVLHCR